MFMLLLLVVATILFVACFVIGAFALEGIVRSIRRFRLKEADVPACALTLALLVGAVQYQAIRQIVPHISVW